MFAQALSILGFAFFLGLEHALEVDHVVAVTTISTKAKSMRRAAILGAWWGLGHISTILILGTIILITKTIIPEHIAQILELIVGIMLIGLGIDVIYKSRTHHSHMHQHEDGTVHYHPHSHEEEDAHHHRHTLKTFFVGMVHGTAGTTALILLIISTVDSLSLGIGYMLSFGLGSIISMSIMAAVLNIPGKIATLKTEKLSQIFNLIAGALSILIGAWLVYRIGFTELDWSAFLL